MQILYHPSRRHQQTPGHRFEANITSAAKVTQFLGAHFTEQLRMRTAQTFGYLLLLLEGWTDPSGHHVAQREVSNAALSGNIFLFFCRWL
jgi:hypothetical protein